MNYPLQALHYFLAFMGGVLGFKDLETAIAIGAIATVFWVFLCIRIVTISRTDPTLLYRAKGWIALGLYSFLTATLTAAGRVGFGVQQGLSSRYVTFSLYAIVSAIYLAAILYETIAPADRVSKLRNRIGIGFLIGIGLVLHVSATDRAVGRMEHWREIILEGRTCTLLVNISVNEPCVQKLHPNIRHITDAAKVIDSMGYIHPPLVKSPQIADIAAGDRNSDRSDNRSDNGYFDLLEPLGDRQYRVWGWAILAHRRQLADAVLLTYKNANDEEIIFQTIYQRVERADVAKAVGEIYLESGWEGAFSLDTLPASAVEVGAWAFDATSGRAYPLIGSHAIKPA
ncbi:hypothetical protein HC928_21810 [bacterium]|nr:hypothetical protein [bacterium]